jgi:peptidoglycan/LPS O-acetylase OafA/YrhL
VHTERIPQLDGLRALAVTFVMAFHFIPGVDRVAPLGSIGVRLFFVLSGFLITRILLQSRDLAIGDALRRFYIRRSLRIFPVFYLVLAIAALINIGPVRSTIGWHVTYLTNVYLFDRGAWHGSISHLWSLAVEEQFYLVWPFVVLSLSERKLAPAIALMVVVAPVTRLLIGGPMNSVLPTSCLDSLGAGALLALPATRDLMIRIGGAIGVPLVAGALALRYAGMRGVPLEVVLDFGVSLSSAWLVGATSRGFSGIVGSALQVKPVVYIGTVSYGLYLFHGFMPYVLGRYVPGFIEMSWPVRALLLTVATFAVAALSWKVFEAPILRLKDKLSDRQVAGAESLAA